MVQTNNEKYGMNVSPNTLKRAKERVSSGEIGFKSKKYEQYLADNSIKNISQLDSVKQKRKIQKINEAITNIFDKDRLKGVVVPLFTKDEYKGCDWYIILLNYFFDTNTLINILKQLKSQNKNI